MTLACGHMSTLDWASDYSTGFMQFRVEAFMLAPFFLLGQATFQHNKDDRKYNGLVPF